jgi:hypothetical protein
LLDKNLSPLQLQQQAFRYWPPISHVKAMQWGELPRVNMRRR